MAADGIGILGGTFDPIHNQHLLMARAACRMLGLARVWFVPVGQPSHRDPTMVSAAHDRCAMVALAVAIDPRFELSTVDVERPGPTYTIDTVCDLAGDHPPGTRFHLLVGADNLAEIRGWHRSDDLLTAVHVVGSSRWGFPLVNPGVPPDRLTLIRIPHWQMSSTEIRRRAASRLPLDHLTPSPVAHYIRRRGLYRPRRWSSTRRLRRAVAVSTRSLSMSRSA